MQTLIIKDLVKTEELDSKAMAAVSGGTGYGYCAPTPVYCPPTPSYCPPEASWGGPHLGLTSNSFDFNASQMLGQSQNTTVNNGNNVAFASGITANVNPHQNGKNTINFG